SPTRTCIDTSPAPCLTTILTISTSAMKESKGSSLGRLKPRTLTRQPEQSLQVHRRQTSTLTIQALPTPHPCRQLRLRRLAESRPFDHDPPALAPEWSPSPTTRL